MFTSYIHYLVKFAMDFLVSIILVSLLLLAYLKNLIHKRDRKALPKAAGSWPIIGHLHLLAGPQLPHKLLGSMADNYGPIFTISIGLHQALVVSNSEMARQCLTTNDKAFASRPKAMVTELMGYNYANFTLAPYGPYWGQLRKMVVLELVSQRRLRMLAHVRASEVRLAIKGMYQSQGVQVDMKAWLENLTLNVIVRMISGKRFSPGDGDGERFRKAVRRFVELLGAFVPSDAIPWLRWFDLGGYQKKMKKTAQEMDEIMHGWLEEHMEKIRGGEGEGEEQVFMAALLSRIQEEFKEDVCGFGAETIVKATCLAILAAATDTTTVTLTWALALLVNNPLVLAKVQQELETNVGRSRQVEETDLKKLVYLEAVIKETMRLYPAAPLSVPHESTEDCMVGGYNVPKGTRLFVNIWKIHHDPQLWTDPFEFKPERFMTSQKKIDVMGQDFELIPFGSGRRMCLGISFALQAMRLILASLIHGFELENPSKEAIDMTESRGLTNLKATSLLLLVVPRLPPNLY